MRDPIPDRQELLERIEELTQENSTLKRMLSEQQGLMASTEATAMTGEEFVVKLIGGVQTGHNDSSDILLNGIRIEVKTSDLSSPNGGATKRWSWAQVFGDGGKKVFDSLILIGEIDIEHRSKYREPDSPFVIFEIPFSDLRGSEELTVKSGRNNNRSIVLSTNPNSVRASGSKRLFHEYQVTRDELRGRYPTQ